VGDVEEGTAQVDSELDLERRSGLKCELKLAEMTRTTTCAREIFGS
jgi:hypothetical protein